MASDQSASSVAEKASSYMGLPSELYISRHEHDRLNVVVAGP
jgi:hypothetical protein